MRKAVIYGVFAGAAAFLLSGCMTIPENGSFTCVMVNRVVTCGIEVPPVTPVAP